MPEPSARQQAGFTLVELVVGMLVLAIGITALLQAFLGQVTMDEHARNLAWAMNDASRVMEQIRQQNTGGGCTNPSVTPPAGFLSWNAWLADVNGGGGKSIQPDPANNELVVATPPTGTGAAPLTVTVAVCWRQRGRIIGECLPNGAALIQNPGAGGNPAITESPAMVSTVITCRP